MKNIGILGGTFDPFHNGHLSVLQASLEELEFDQILLMPAKVSPFKIGREMASQEDRLAMIRMVAEHYPKLEVTTIELEAERVSYTYETLKCIQRIYPDAKIWFIMGSDSLLALETWYNGESLISEFNFVLAPRPGYDLLETDETARRYIDRYGTQIRVLNNKLVNISSTEIKEAIRAGRSIDAYVPAEVRDYIEEHRLYI